jgi:light-regulated signal transduction histidine kinase (bacteriophytochrome)
MSDLLTSPPFGQADLTNCERELIHLAGSIQPHGVLFVVREPDLAVLQASANIEAFFGVRAGSLLGQRIGSLGGDLETVLRRLAGAADLTGPEPLRCVIGHDAAVREFEGIAHRNPGAGLVVELEPVAGTCDAADADDHRLQRALAAAVRRFSETSTVAALADAVVQSVRDLVGYDRVMVYKFDPDGHGKVIAEARDERLEAFLGRHYPASDIPQRARELYVRNRVRVLVDVDYAPVPVEPRHSPLTGEELDMSLCALRSMSPLHTQYLRNMGVTATLVASLVRDGRLWGLIACHHYSPRRVRYAVRAATDVLAEVIVTRIAAIENYVQTQAEVLVRRLEQRLIEATSVEGDWRHALVGNPRFLLLPFEATGAALFYDGEVHTVGEVPSTPELRALADWVGGRTVDSLFECASVARANPSLESLTPTASGVLAVELSRSRPDYLMWFRKEQLLTMDWAGDPAKPVIGDDPLELSPRRSFAVWSEIVRETSAPWTHADLALAAAMGASLRDILVQIHAVRLLIAQHQLMQVRVAVDRSKSPVVIADAGGRILLANEAFSRLLRRPHGHLQHLEDIAAFFSEPQVVRRVLGLLRSDRQAWRGELSLAGGGPERVPLGVRADVVPGPDGVVLGFILIVSDLTETKRAEEARRHLEDSLLRAGREGVEVRPAPEPDEVMGAILANASVAGMEIADAGGRSAVAPLLEELESSAKRAAALYRQLRAYTRDR